MRDGGSMTECRSPVAVLDRILQKKGEKMGTFLVTVLVGILVFLFLGWVISIPYKWVKRRQRRAGVRTNAQVELSDAIADALRREREERQSD